MYWGEFSEAEDATILFHWHVGESANSFRSFCVFSHIFSDAFLQFRSDSKDAQSQGGGGDPHIFRHFSPRLAVRFVIVNPVFDEKPRIRFGKLAEGFF